MPALENLEFSLLFPSEFSLPEKETLTTLIYNNYVAQHLFNGHFRDLPENPHVWQSNLYAKFLSLTFSDNEKRNSESLNLVSLLLSHFIQLNWVGPPDNSLISGNRNTAYLDALVVDGETPHSLCEGPEVLFTAKWLCNSLDECGMFSVVLWRARIAFLQQNLLNEDSASCQRLCLLDIIELYKAWEILPKDFQLKKSVYVTENEIAGTQQLTIVPAPSIPMKLKSHLLLELALRMTYYHLKAEYFDVVLELGCATAGLHYEVTGELGIRRTHQQNPVPQLVVKTDTATCFPSSDEVGPEKEGVTLKELDPMSDILEAPKLLSEEAQKASSSQLPDLERSLLLCRAHYLIQNSPVGDFLTLETVGALVMRALRGGGSVNWLILNFGFYLRSCTEHHRSKTMDRASLQLSALIDQFNEKEPEVLERVRCFFNLGYPARWVAMRELGQRMMNLGAVLSAQEMFLKMEMWEDAVDCLVVAQRNSEALELIQDRLKIKPTPALWCSHGDVAKDPTAYHKAWSLSGQSNARSQRSLGRYHFEKAQYLEASLCFKTALELNPLKPNTWFTLGVCYMRIGDWKDAISAFGRSVSIDGEQAECWANLAACHSQLGNLEHASTCIRQAVKYAREAWRMWDSLVKISMRLRDLSGVMEGIECMCELDQKVQIDEVIFTFIAETVIREDGLCSPDSPLNTTQELVLKFFGKITNSYFADRPCVWRNFSQILEHSGICEEALSVRMKEFRALARFLGKEMLSGVTKSGYGSTTELINALVQCVIAVRALLGKVAGSNPTREDFVLAFQTCSAKLFQLKDSDNSLDVSVQMFERELGCLKGDE